MPIATLLAVVGSLIFPAAASEAPPQLRSESIPSRILTSRPESSKPDSAEYSRGSGVPAGRLAAVLESSQAPDLNSSTAAQSQQHGPESDDLLSKASSSKLQEPSQTADVAGDGRDRVSDVLKVLDRKLDNAISGAQGSALRAIPSVASSEAIRIEQLEEMKKSRELATEAVELVHQVSVYNVCKLNASNLEVNSQVYLGLKRAVCIHCSHRITHKVFISRPLYYSMRHRRKWKILQYTVSFYCFQVWLDARSTGLDRDKWLQDCMKELDAKPPKTQLQAHLLIKGFLARGPSDPYTRFIPPDEFKKLTKFDVSGAGANLVTAEEYQQKIVKSLPRNKTPADGGVWVVGLIKVLFPVLLCKFHRLIAIKSTHV